MTRAPSDLPVFNRASPPRIVVIGFGEVVQRYYLGAFKKLADERQQERLSPLDVTFVDRRELWSTEASSVRDAVITAMNQEQWGARYVDRSEAKYWNLEPEVVIVATPDSTHASIAAEWYRRENSAPYIIIEKPIDSSIESVKELIKEIGYSNPRVWGFDHYLPRAFLDHEVLEAITQHLGYRPIDPTYSGNPGSPRTRGLRRFAFYCFENHSGDDPDHNNQLRNRQPPWVQKDGAIENERRVTALNAGSLLDMAPHVIAVLNTFCPVDTMRVTRVRAGQSIGVGGDPDRRTSIDGETFAEVGLVCADSYSYLVEGDLYVGKGVLGSKALGSEFDNNTKALELIGMDDCWIRLDIRDKKDDQGNDSRARVHFFTGDSQVKPPIWLLHKPYEAFLRRVVDHTFTERTNALVFPVEQGLQMLQLIDDMRAPIPTGSALAAYPSGMEERSGVAGRRSLYLEEIQRRLPILLGRRLND